MSFMYDEGGCRGVKWEGFGFTENQGQNLCTCPFLLNNGPDSVDVNF